MTPNTRPFPSLICLLALTLGLTEIFLIQGCASLAPGSEAFVVRVEQTQKGAEATFDFVLGVDNADRGLWRTNAPAFHTFCEWLRTPAPTLARVLTIEENVQLLKMRYKASRTEGNSNALYSAWATLDTAVGQSLSWSNIVTLPIHPL